MTNDDFKLLVPDLNMRKFIRGGIVKNTFNSVNNLMLLCNNALTLTFLYSYSLYRKQLNSDGLEMLLANSNANSLRVIDTMQKVYIKYPISLELIQFVLLDIQFDIMHGESSVLTRFIPDALTTYGNFSIVEHNKIITRMRKSDRYLSESGLDLAKAELLLVELLEHLPFLKTRELIRINDNANTNINEYVFRKRKCEYLEEKDVSACYVLSNFSEDENTSEFLYLQDISNFDGGYKLRYVSPSADIVRNLYCVSDDFSSAIKEASAKELIRKRPDELFFEIVGVIKTSAETTVKKLSEISVISDVYSINYRYVKNLALAISDAISLDYLSEAKDMLREEYKKNYPHAFESVIEKDGIMYENWDSIIVMLLIEAGPTQILQSLIEKNKAFYKIVVKNLSQRFGPSYSLYAIKDMERELENLATQLIDSSSPDIAIRNDFFGATRITARLRAGLLAEAKANVILNSLMDINGSNRKFSLIYIGNLQTKIRLLKDSYNSNDFEKQKQYIKYTLGESLKQLICFYKGVYAYGKEKLEYDYVSGDKCLDDDIVEDYKRSISGAFMRAARVEAEKIKQDPKLGNNEIIPLIKRFLEVCDECCYATNESEDLGNSGRFLFSALGKYEIIDRKNVVNLIPFNLSNTIKLDESNIKKFVGFSLKVLEYLKTGSFNNETGLDNTINAIYPFVARLTRGNENKDGYKTITFQLSVDVENDGFDNFYHEINVLSEFNYDFDEKYYCLPNLARSNDKWWIDPLLIGYQEFNSIFN